MGYIWILQRLQGSNALPRPYSQAVSNSELIELLPRGAIANLSNIDSDEPVSIHGVHEYFAFRAL